MTVNDYATCPTDTPEMAQHRRMLQGLHPGNPLQVAYRMYLRFGEPGPRVMVAGKGGRCVFRAEDGRERGPDGRFAPAGLPAMPATSVEPDDDEPICLRCGGELYAGDDRDRDRDETMCSACIEADDRGEI